MLNLSSLNQRVNALSSRINGIPAPGVSNLNDTLIAGDNAGGLDITNLNNINLTTINGGAYPIPVVVPTLGGVLASGNDGGGLDITNVNNLDTTSINNIAYLPYFNHPTTILVKTTTIPFIVPYNVGYLSALLGTKATGFNSSTNTPSTTANADVITFSKTGYYLLEANLHMTNPANILGTSIALTLNNETTGQIFIRGENVGCNCGGFGGANLNISQIAFGTLNDKMCLRVFQNYNNTASLPTLSIQTRFSATFLSTI